MAVQAYVLADCAWGKAHEVVQALRKLPGVEAAHAVTGSYDVIAFLRAESMAALADVLTRRIQALPGLIGTTTNVVVEPFVAPRNGERPTTASTLHAPLRHQAMTPRGVDTGDARLAMDLVGGGQGARRRRKQ